MKWQLDGYYYNFYLEALQEGHEQYAVRSRDSTHWEAKPVNLVLRASDEDRVAANAHLVPEQRQRIRTAKDTNNSGVGFWKWEGQMVINCSRGNQQGIEHLAEARHDGTLTRFLPGWFSADKAQPLPRADASQAAPLKPSSRFIRWRGRQC